MVNCYSDNGTQHQLSNEFGGGLHAFFVLLEYLDVVVDPANHAHPNGAYDHHNDVDGIESRQQKRWNNDAQNDDNATHGRGAFFLHLSFKTQFADGFPNLLALQPSDDAFAGNQSQKQAQDSCQRSTE